MLAGNYSVIRGLSLQYLRFGSVGAGATATHVALFVLLIELFGTPALLANLLAFAAAVLVSFVGHSQWTFPARREHRARWLALCKFAVTAIGGFGLNSLLVYGIIDTMDWHYSYAVAAMVTVTPIGLFLLSKFWAFA